jgi:hypothetical protein
MLALKRFTMNDLARFSGVKYATVRTLLRDLRGYYAVDDDTPPAPRHPGGQPTHYALTPDQSARIRHELQALEIQLPNAPFVPDEMDDEAVRAHFAGTAELHLRAARQLIETAWKAPDLSERARLRASAAATLQTARASVAAAERSGMLDRWAAVRARTTLGLLTTQLGVPGLGLGLSIALGASTKPYLRIKAPEGSLKAQGAAAGSTRNPVFKIAYDPAHGVPPRRVHQDPLESLLKATGERAATFRLKQVGEALPEE